MKNNRHKKTSALAGAEVWGNESNYQERNVMANNSTAVSNVIPFRFEAKEVRTILIEDQPWFVAGDVSLALEYRDSFNMCRNLDDDEKGTQIVSTPGGSQEMLVINESGLYSAILRSRKTEAKRFKKWVTAEVLPAIRKHGRYEDHSNKMSTLMDQLSLSQFNTIKGVIRDKTKAAPAEKRQGLQLVMHNRLHTRFNVPRTELIPASQFDSACNFIAAYAIEGEYLPKQEGTQVTGNPLSRYLVSFNYKGEQQVREIPKDACVMTYEEMLRELVAPNGLPVSTEEMFGFVVAAIANLKARSEYQARRVAA